MIVTGFNMNRGKVDKDRYRIPAVVRESSKLKLNSGTRTNTPKVIINS